MGTAPWLRRDKPCKGEVTQPCLGALRTPTLCPGVQLTVPMPGPAVWFLVTSVSTDSCL